jgi:hypothetical protein
VRAEAARRPRRHHEPGGEEGTRTLEPGDRGRACDGDCARRSNAAVSPCEGYVFLCLLPLLLFSLFHLFFWRLLMRSCPAPQTDAEAALAGLHSLRSPVPSLGIHRYYGCPNDSPSNYPVVWLLRSCSKFAACPYQWSPAKRCRLQQQLDDVDAPSKPTFAPIHNNCGTV